VVFASIKINCRRPRQIFKPQSLIAGLVLVFVCIGACLTVAETRDFSFIPPQQVLYWSPPTQFGEVSKQWFPPPGYEKTEQPWAPPKGFATPPKGWEAPKGWGKPPEWSPPSEFKGKVIREEIPKTSPPEKQELEKPQSW